MDTPDKIARHNRQRRRVVVAVAVIICVFAGIYLYTNSLGYLLSKWHTNENDRIRTGYKLVEKAELIGKTEDEIVSLLGEGAPQRSFKIGNADYTGQDILVYYLGADILDSLWMIIIFDGGVAVDIEYNIT